MFKNQISKKGMYEAPEDKEVDILLYAAENIKNVDESETELSDYISWLPCVSTLLIIRDFFSGQKIRISPVFEI